MRTTNSGSPYIGVFVAGQMISLDDIERPTATGQYGLYEEGLLAQLLAEKTRELLGS